MSLLQELADAKARIAMLEEVVEDLLGPDPDVPDWADRRSLDVARPPLTAAFWKKGPWSCLRIEERTVGYDRPSVFLLNGKVRVRQANVVERWMRWINGLMDAFEVEPIPEGHKVRVIFVPGQVWTFMAWREVERSGNLHPQDPDNLVKPILDGCQTRPYSAKDPRRYGAFLNDTQIVDLMIYRIPQAGAAAVNRQAITRARSAEKKRSHKKRLDVAEQEAAAAGTGTDPAAGAPGAGM